MILSTGLPPALSVEQLEDWRKHITGRLLLLAQQEEVHPLAVEQFDYNDSWVAFAAREKLRALLRHRLSTIRTRIQELS